MGELGTILAVWAHPDDETYLCGALMARAVQQGDRVVCVTATRGELGSTDPDRWPAGPALAEVRTRELAEAMAALGVTEHIWLDYPDGGCADVDDEEAIARLVAVVEEVRPETVLTFGPDGMTGHDDHRTVSRWTTVALSRSTVAGTASLHYATNTPEWLTRWYEQLEPLGVFMGAQPPQTPRDDCSLFLIADGELLERKIRSITCQVSQVEPLLNAFGEANFRQSIAEEAFRAAPR